MKATVVVLRTRPETVIEDYAHLMAQAQVERHLPRESHVILKDNISWHFPFLSANTTPWQLEGVTKALRDAHYHQLTCVQNRTVVTNAYKGESLNRYLPILRRYGVPVLYNFRDQDMAWVDYQPKSKLLALDKVFPDGIRIPDFFMGKSVLHLPTVKCHIYTTTTGAMKNAFGGLLNTRRHYTHTWIHETLVDLLAIQREIHSGLFAVMDGTVAGNGPGPRTMFPVDKNVILASADQVAIDAVAAKMMGFDPMSIAYIRLAHEQGLGVGDPSQIQIVGETDCLSWNWHFNVGDNLASRVGDVLWFGALKQAQNLAFRTPLVNLFVLGSFLYHDYCWWPTAGRKRMADFKAISPWGQLFERYPEE